MRQHSIKRDTAETKINIDFLIDGTGKSNINTKIGFLVHMLTLCTSHGLFDLTVDCDGDIEVDYHHTTEDIGITVGIAFEQSIGNTDGMSSYSLFTVPWFDCKAHSD